MDVKKKLFKIFGPIILAAVLLTLLLVSPFNFRKINDKTVEVATPCPSQRIFLKGQW